MLSFSPLRRQATAPFVCWKCLARSQQPRVVRTSERTRSRLVAVTAGDGGTRLFRRGFHAGQTTRAIVETQTRAFDAPQLEPIDPGLALRERLRQWEKENQAEYDPPAELHDSIQPGQTANTLNRSNVNLRTVDGEGDHSEDRVYAYSPDQLIDVGHSRSFLLPGDLVSFTTSSSHQQILAVFVQHLEFQSQFYTMSGRWLHRPQAAPKFSIPGFAKLDEIKPLLPYLPDADIPASDMEKLHGFTEALPRTVGRPLVLRMIEFWNRADAVYQANHTVLDNAHSILAHPKEFSYATLEQMTDKLLTRLPQKARRSGHVLYAVHRKILAEDIGFEAQEEQVMRTGTLYEIKSKSEVTAIRLTTKFVRNYRSALITKNYSSCKPFMRFLERARRRIDYSRTFREFTPFGTLGPSKIKTQTGTDSQDRHHYRDGEVGEAWQQDDSMFLDFMESWACFRSFKRDAIASGIGSEILRALGRYDDVDLGRTTAITFLKEIGAIPPWENIAAYALRLPFTGRRLGLGFGSTPLDGFTVDKMESLRKDWGDMPVYCVDDHNAHEIDDGISLEATEKPDEYWLHVHVADPAAHMDPTGAAAKYAEDVTETVYFPERRVPMLHEDKVGKNYSLAPNRPCLTFSTRLNMDGEIIDTVVTGGTIRNVVYMDPNVLQNVTAGITERKYVIFGTESDEQVGVSNLVDRPLIDAESLSSTQRAELNLLHKLTHARFSHWQRKGGVSLDRERSTIRVSFDGAPWKKPRKGNYSRWHYGDPKIVIAVPEDQGKAVSSPFSIVTTSMLIAGETAARWCSARGIPLPYRITPRHPEKDPSKFFEENVRQFVDRGEPIPMEVLTQYFNTIGKVQPSTVPGPHLGIGTDMIARCTSPLRRFADLVAAWQIEAALLEEARTGKSLVGNTREDFLPFSKARLDSILPRLSHREKFIYHCNSRSDRYWATQFLVHGWKFGTHKLPERLFFVVRSVNPDIMTAGGVITNLDIGGTMFVPSWTKVEDVNIDDRFEVEIELIDVLHQVVQLRAVRRVKE